MRRSLALCWPPENSGLCGGEGGQRIDGVPQSGASAAYRIYQVGHRPTVQRARYSDLGRRADGAGADPSGVRKRVPNRCTGGAGAAGAAQMADPDRPDGRLADPVARQIGQLEALDRSPHGGRPMACRRAETASTQDGQGEYTECRRRPGHGHSTGRARPRFPSCATAGILRTFAVAVAQLVVAPGCGPGGRGFESHRSPSPRSRPCTVSAGARRRPGAPRARSAAGSRMPAGPDPGCPPASAARASAPSAPPLPRAPWPRCRRPRPPVVVAQQHLAAAGVEHLR